MFSYEESSSSSSMLPDFGAVPAPRARNKLLANGVEIYYKEAVPSIRSSLNDESNVLLLHGFPTSSNYFRNLLPLLAARGHRVVAPDLPGFGVTQCPKTSFTFSLQKISETIVLLIDSLDINDSLVVYCHGEYGTLVGLRLAQYKLESIAGLIVQNGSAFLGSRLKPGLFDIFKPGVLQPHMRVSGGFSSGNLSESGQFKPRSCLSSMRSSNSNLDNVEHEGNHQKRESVAPRSRVSFGQEVEEIKIDKAGAMLARTKSNVIDTDSENSKDDSCNSENYPRDPECNSLILTSPEMHATIIKTDSSSSSDNDDDAGLTVDKLKNLYAPSQATRFPGNCKKPDFSHNYPHTIDMQAVLLDYYFLSQPGQPYIQKQLYKDYVHQITSPSAPASMWLRTTNTPLLVLWGTHDPLLAQDSTLEAFKRDCRFFFCRTFDQGGHFAAEYYSDEIAISVNDFIQKNCREKKW